MAKSTNINKYTAEKIKQEISDLDTTDYSQIISWMLKQNYGKIGYIAQLADVNCFVKLVAVNMVNDMKSNSARLLNTVLPYVAKKQPTREEVTTYDETPQLHIQVSNDVIENNINKLIGKNADN